jgi:regulator of RNase E activity RraA
MFDSDAEIFDFVRSHLYVPAVCDILDTLGFRQQAMHQRIRPLLPDIRRCGFVEIEAMDSLKGGDVAVHSTDPGGTNAPWGELMSTIAKRNGAVGCVVDSQIRDCVRIIDMGFPVYYAGIRPLDSMGRARVMAFDVPIRCGDVLVRAGELVFADFDGVVVVPREVEKDVLRLAQEKAGKENQARKDLLAGKTLRQVFEKYRVL